MRNNNALLESLSIVSIPTSATVDGPKRNWTKPLYQKSRSSNRIAKQDVEFIQVQKNNYQKKLTYGGINEIGFGSPEHFTKESDLFALSISEAKHLDNTVRCHATSSDYPPDPADIKTFITEITETMAKARCQEKKQRFGPWNNPSVCCKKLVEYCLAELIRLNWLNYIYSTAQNNKKFRILGVITGIFLLLKVSLYTFLTLQAGGEPL